MINHLLQHKLEVCIVDNSLLLLTSNGNQCSKNAVDDIRHVELVISIEEAVTPKLIFKSGCIHK